ncbi:MAG TPA: hypothetical protein VM639_00870 [Dongiaceae bacterium]|nr:hypothetical protein [Dongiaceae bacterium]
MHEKSSCNGWCAAFLVILIGVAFFAAYAGQHVFEYHGEGACLNIGPISLKCEIGFGDFLVAAFTAALWAATWRLVKGADDTAKHQLRAYIGIERVSGATGAREIIESIEIRNFGNTPAYNLRISNRALVTNHQDHDFSAMDEGEFICGVLMPGGTFKLEMGLKVGPDFYLNDLLDGIAFGLCWGDIMYKDAFGNDHVTRFRFKTNCTRNGIRHLMLNEGNSAD